MHENSRPDERLILPRLLEHRARTTPDQLFLTEVNGASLTYAQVYERVESIARSLRSRGLGPGDRLLSMMPTSIDSAITWFSANLVGATHVPVSMEYLGHLLQHVIALTEPTVIALDSRVVGRFEGLEIPGSVKAVYLRQGNPVESAIAMRVFGSEVDSLESPRAAAFLQREELRIPPVEWADPACLMFTSGTTGPSKAVVQTWLQLYVHAMRCYQGESAGPMDKIYIPWPMNHTSGASNLYMGAIMGGAVLLREKWSTSSFLDDVFDYRCTMTTLISSTARYAEDLNIPTNRGPCPLNKVFVVPTSTSTNDFLASLGATGSTVYAMTEVAAPIYAVGLDQLPEGSCGRRAEGAELRIIDEHGDDVPPGAVGQLLVRFQDEAVMSAGYWRMPDATAKAYAGGWFHTGDLMRCDAEGYYYFVDRMHDRMRHRGENISSHELETVVKRLAGVVDCAAVAIPASDEDDDVVLFVETGEVLTVSEIASYCKENLPRFMNPAFIVTDVPFPRTGTQKIEKGKLREIARRRFRTDPGESPALRSENHV